MKVRAVLGGLLLIKPRINLKTLPRRAFNYQQDPEINRPRLVYETLGVAGGGNSRFLHGSSSQLIEKKLTEMTDKDWEKKLTPDQYYVCRERGTEPPFSGKFYNHFEKGMYSCVCCGVELFSSESKFQSGCGWPSFHTAHGAVNGDESKSNVIRRPDNSRGMLRTEVICKNCDSHLGHVFNDGPKPTGERFCINSLTLNFTPKQ